MINIADLLLENNTASERPNNDNPIVDYSDNHEKIDNDTKVEDNEPLEETYIASKKDMEYKLDSWKKGSNNILLITGLSGSGKSTRASQLSKEYNAINFELDLFEHNSILFSNNYNHDEANIIMKDIFKKMYGGKKNFDKYSDEDYRKEFVKFFKNLLSYCKSHRDQLFIIEGLQIFKHVAYYDISILENIPIIIIGTSLTKSLVRRYKRDHNTSDGSFKHPIQLMKKYIEWEKSLNNLRNSDYLKEFVEDNEPLEESKVYYRITYDGEGIYNAFKNNVSKDIWQDFKNNKNNCGWLPVPPNYGDNDRSYFTKYGYDKFMKTAYKDIIKYLDKEKISIDKYTDIRNIRYSDKYQIVTESVEENEPLDEAVETRLTKPFIGKEITLYTGSPKKLNIIDPVNSRINNPDKYTKGINLGTRFSAPRYSSYWCDNDMHPKFFAFHRELLQKVGDAYNITWLEVYNEHIRGAYNKEKFYMKKSEKSDILPILKSIKIYIHKVTVPTKIVGRGHHKIHDEYTLDIAVKPDDIYEVDWNDEYIQSCYEFIDDNKFEKLEDVARLKHSSRPKRGWNPLYDLVYHNDEELKSIKKLVKSKINEPSNLHENFAASDYFGYYVSDKGNLNGNDIDEDLTYKNEFQAIRFYLNSGKDEGDCYLYATKKEEPNTLILLGKININDKGEEVGYKFLEESSNNSELSDTPKINSKYLENKDDIYNIKNWTPDKYNILFITGMSGSGKTTLGEDLAKINKCQRVELDCIVYYFLNRVREKGKQQNPVNQLKKDCPDAAKFFTTERDAKYHLESWGDHVPVTKEFLDWFIPTHEGDGNLYIINGAQIPDALDYDFFGERPIIIKDPNLVKNVTRRTMRESKFSNYDSFSGWIRGFGRHIKLYTDKGYRNSVKRLKKFSNNINNIYESVDGSELYPVYIVTSYTDTKFGKIIRKASDCYYTHAAISFESNLHEMYSFGNSGTLSNSKLGGMTCESLNDYIKTSKNAVILVSVVFVKEKDYKKLLAFFDEYLNNSRNTRYNYSNLFNVLKNKPIPNMPSLSYICSQFVDSLFKFISIDMTNKPSNLVTPEDIANLHNVKPTVYKLFEGKAVDYNVSRIERILDKMYSKAKPIKEVTLLEAKEFPIQFNDEGDLLISKKEKIDFLAEYNKSKKLRQSYVKYKNLEGLKYECCKMWYINTILMKLLDDKNLSHSDREDYNNYRSKILTEFSQYLKEIQKIDKSFNFGSFYETTPFSNTKIKINGSTIKYTTKLMKFIFK